MVDFQAAVDRVRAAALVTERMPGADGSVVLDHGRAEQLVRLYADLAKTSGKDIEGAVVLDAGCGAGASSIALAALGAATVYAVEIDAEKVAGLERCRDAIGTFAEALRPIEASVLELPLDASSVDVVISNEAIGVYSDLGAFLDESARVLRPGGAVVMSEMNDVLNPKLRARARQLWRAYELGPAGKHFGHTIERPYRDQRAALVRETLPEAPREIVEQIAANSFGYDAGAVRDACAQWSATATLPDSPYDPDRAPMDLDGLLVEAPVDPRWMRAALRERGMRVRVSGYWGGIAGSSVTRVADRALRMLGPVSLRSARAIRYVGTKASVIAIVLAERLCSYGSVFEQGGIGV